MLFSEGMGLWVEARYVLGGTFVARRPDLLIGQVPARLGRLANRSFKSKKSGLRDPRRG